MAFVFFIVIALISVFGATLLLRVVGGVKSFADLETFCAEGVFLVSFVSLTGVFPRLLVCAGVTFLTGSSVAGEAIMVTFLVIGVFGGGVCFAAFLDTCAFFTVGVKVRGAVMGTEIIVDGGVLEGAEVFAEVGVLEGAEIIVDRGVLEGTEVFAEVGDLSEADEGVFVDIEVLLDTYVLARDIVLSEEVTIADGGVFPGTNVFAEEVIFVEKVF